MPKRSPWFHRLAAVVGVLAVVLGGCGRGGGKAAKGGAENRPSAIRVASFDFPESEVLAQIYAQALSKHNLPATVLSQLGSREIIEPALEQGKVDLVPEYIGTALDFVRNARVATADAPATYAKLRDALASRELVALRYAPGQDANGFAVTKQVAARLNLERLSDLRGIAAQLNFGGPPECPERPLCLLGLQDTYGLHFKTFKPMSTRAITATALETEEIDVGMLETTDGNLASGRFVLLADDRGLQPAENVVPVARREVVDAHGTELARVLDAISARLSTSELAALNRRVDIDRRTAADVAADWLEREGL